MSFCTVINCMDGRVQDCVNAFMKKRFGTDFVDVVTEPGPIRMLSERSDEGVVNSILKRVDISVNKHGSKAIGIVSHYDCTGNPVSKEIQNKQLRESVEYISDKYQEAEVIGLWVSSEWKVEEVNFD